MLMMRLTRMLGRRLLAVLWLGALLSALAVVTVRHQNRLAFVDWRKAEAEKIELQSERGRLMLEKATLGGRRGIVDDARQQLGMVTPAPAKIIPLKLPAATVTTD